MMNEGVQSPLLTAYRVASTLGRPAAAPLLWWRQQRGKEEPARRSERYGEASRPRPEGRVVWVHAASVGETVAAIPLIEAIAARHGAAILLTTGTVTSAEVAAKRLNGRVTHQYVPLDNVPIIRRFLDHWRPDAAILVESELWPNLILETAARAVPLALVNARMSERSFRRWQRAPAMIARLLAGFDLCLAQTPADAARFAALGARRVETPGNLKLDAPPPEASAQELAALSGALGKRPRWLAASIHPGEIEAVLDAHEKAAAGVEGLMTLVAPRHPERGPMMADLAAARGHKVALRSHSSLPSADDALFVLDTIGELGLVIRLSPIVFMGGSLIPHGGQNPIEPAKLSAAILHGPHVDNFADIYGVLDDAGGAVRVSDAASLAEEVAGHLAMPATAAARARAAQAAIAPLTGALERVLEALDPLLAQGTGRRERRQ